MEDLNILKNKITINIEKKLYLLAVKEEKNKTTTYSPLIRINDMTKKISIYHDNDLIAFQKATYNERMVLEEYGCTIFFIPVEYGKFKIYKDAIDQNQENIISKYLSLKEQMLGAYGENNVSEKMDFEDYVILGMLSSTKSCPCFSESLAVLL